MTETAFERDARRFIEAYMREETLKFGDNYADPKTTDDLYRAQFLNTMVDAVRDQQQAGNFIFSARAYPDSIDVVVQTSINRFSGNKLRLYVKHEIFGYSAQLNLYVKDNAVPITPQMKVKKDVVTERDVYALVPDARTRDAHFYIGLIAPEVNAMQRIPQVETMPVEENPLMDC